MNIWCMLGHHKWKTNPNYTWLSERERTCNRCGKHEHSRFSFYTSGPVWDFVEYHNVHLNGGKED